MWFALLWGRSALIRITSDAVDLTCGMQAHLMFGLSFVFFVLPAFVFRAADLRSLSVFCGVQL
jgi:hypothetical protein